MQDNSCGEKILSDVRGGCELINKYKINVMQIREASGDMVVSSKKAAALLKKESMADRELFVVLHLNAKNRLIEKEIVSMGTLSEASVHPREVFKKAFINSSASLIVAHNHPSGDCVPSKQDDRIMRRLYYISELHGVKLLDALVLGRGKHYSYADEGHIQEWGIRWKANDLAI